MLSPRFTLTDISPTYLIDTPSPSFSRHLRHFDLRFSLLIYFRQRHYASLSAARERAARLRAHAMPCAIIYFRAAAPLFAARRDGAGAPAPAL